MAGATISRIEATAHHEAGHAVASWHCGIRFKYVTIVPDITQNSLGHLENNSSPRVQNLTQDHIYVGLAGQIAEAKFRGRRPRYGMNTDNADNQNAFDLAMCFCCSDKTASAYLRYCWCGSADIVDLRWREITVVAAALLRKKTLRYPDVVEAILAASHQPQRAAAPL